MFGRSAASTIAVLGVLTALTACSNTETGTALPANSRPTVSSDAPTSPSSRVLTPAELCTALHASGPAAFSEILDIDKVVVSPFGPGALCRFSGQRPTDFYPTAGAATALMSTNETVQSLTAKNQQGMIAKLHNIQITPVADLPGAQVISGIDDMRVTRGFGAVAVSGGLLEITLSGPKVTADIIGRALKVVYDAAKS